MLISLAAAGYGYTREVVHSFELMSGSSSQAINERRQAWFPGWTMLSVSGLAQFMSGPGQSYSVAAFKEPMRESLGLSETAYSLPYGVATVVSGLSLILTGRLIDHFGARKTLPIISALLGLACFVMSQVDSGNQLYLGFTLIRCVGQGAMTLVALWIVGEWFLRRRCFATAISSLGSSTSVMVFPLLNIWLIDSFGWRNAWIALGLLVTGSLAVPGWILLRDRPEDLGMLPDGDDSQQDTVTPDGAEGKTVLTGWTVRDAILDPTFWKVSTVPVCSGMIGTGLIFHQVALLGSRGVTANWALGLISIQAGLSTIVGLYAGWLSDRWSYQRMLSIAMVLLSSCVVWILVLPRPWMAIFSSIAMGIHGSILRSAGTVVWINLYGRKHQGAVRGVSMSLMILAAAVGPLPLAVTLDHYGSYDSALCLFAALPLIAGGLVLTARDTETVA